MINDFPYLILVLVLILVIILVRRLDNKEYKDSIDTPIRCPHGYDDWDDCPDCCH